MILDKTSIEGMLYTDSKSFEPIKKGHKDGILIRTDTEANHFTPDEQIGNDSIDLRIADYGYTISTDYSFINTLEQGDRERYYNKISITNKGYILQPGDLIFVPTFERIALSGDLIGRITGRSVFARMGLSVHCTQDKFSSGIDSVAGLQIMNNSKVPLMIFPYQKLAQILIERTDQNRHPYEGEYCREEHMKLPVVKESDLKQYGSIDQELIKNNKSKRRIIPNKEKVQTAIPLSSIIINAITKVLMGVFGSIQNIGGIVAIGVMSLAFNVILFAINKAAIDDRRLRHQE